ncbi:RlpA-like double-psi beta-barrel-protein domain-containing protein-containing protein [Cyathus striatus]|nr:RlpA-like double-psi beta-barrel-protein domain-containing protein-containing protein [Cyathus striatus]
MVSLKLATAATILLSAVSSVFAFTGEEQVGDGRGIGSCGTVINDSDYSAAVAHALFDTYPGAGSNPNANPICGRNLRLTYQGRSVTVKVVDRCADCEGMYNVDLTSTAFQQLAPLSVGRLFGVQWDWV